MLINKCETLKIWHIILRLCVTHGILFLDDERSMLAKIKVTFKGQRSKMYINMLFGQLHTHL